MIVVLLVKRAPVVVRQEAAAMVVAWFWGNAVKGKVHHLFQNGKAYRLRGNASGKPASMSAIHCLIQRA